MIKVHIGQHRDTDYVIHDGRRVLVCPSIMFNKGSSLAPIRVSVNGVSGELNLMHKADGGFAYKLVVPEGPYKGFSRTMVAGECIELEDEDFSKQFYAFYYDETTRERWRCPVETLEDAWLFSEPYTESIV